MAEVCSIDAYVRNKEGRMVVSNLWKDLMKFRGEPQDKKPFEADIREIWSKKID